MHVENTGAHVLIVPAFLGMHSQFWSIAGNPRMRIPATTYHLPTLDKTLMGRIAPVLVSGQVLPRSRPS